MATHPPSARRWYDAYPDVTRFIRAIQVFPAEVQSIICKAVVEMANLEFRVEEQLNQHRSLGSEKLRAFYLARNKRRTYDQNQYVHQTMNYTAILSEENRQFLMQKANEVISLTIDYFGLCKHYQKTPSMDDVSKITEHSIQDGVSAARRYMRQVREIFNQGIGSRAILSPQRLKIDQQGRLRSAE